MIYLLVGKDHYRVNERLNSIRKAAGLANDNTNYQEISGTFDYNEIVTQASAMPFLSEHRMMIVRGILSSKNKDVLDALVAWLPACPPETELVFVEEEMPDQRLGTTKAVQKIAKIENFGELKPYEIAQKIEELVAAKGGKIEKPVASLLQQYLGTDLTLITNEVDKLVTYSPIVTKETVGKLVDAGYFNTIFDFTDALAARNQQKALYHLGKLLESSDNEFYALSMISWQVNNLLLVKDLKEHGLSDAEIATRSKLKPFVVTKTIGMVRNFTIEELILIHRELLTIDESQKTGGADPKVLLTRFVTGVTTKK